MTTQPARASASADGTAASAADPANATAPDIAIPTVDRRTMLGGVLVVVAICMPIMGLQLIAPIIPQIIDHFAEQPGIDVLGPLSMTVPALGIAVFGPFFGPIINRFGRLPVLYTALATYSLFGTAPLWLDSFGGYFASRVLLGLSEAAIMTSSLTLLGDYFSGRTRDKFMSAQAAASSVGAVVFIAIGGLLGSLGWRAPFVMYFLPILLLLLMIPVLREPRRTVRAEATVKTPLPWKVMIAPLIITVLGSLVFFAMQTQLSIVLDGFAEGPAQIALSAGLANLGVVAGTILFATGVKRFSVGALLVTGIALAALGLLPIGLGGSFVVITLGAVVAGVGGGLVLPSMLIGTTAQLSFTQRSKGTAAWTTAFQVGTVLSPLTIAALTGATGGLGTSITIMGVFGLVLAIGAGFTVRRRPLQSNAQSGASVE